MLDNNYPEKSRGTFSFLVSTRGIFFLSVTYVRLRLLLAFSKNVRKLLSRSGTRALRENNYPNKWRAPFLKRYFFSFFIPSFLPFRSVFSSCLSFSERNGKPKEGRECERKRGEGEEGQTERRSKREERKGFKERKGQNDREAEQEGRKERKEQKDRKGRRRKRGRKGTHERKERQRK